MHYESLNISTSEQFAFTIYMNLRGSDFLRDAAHIEGKSRPFSTENKDKPKSVFIRKDTSSQFLLPTCTIISYKPSSARAD